MSVRKRRVSFSDEVIENVEISKTLLEAKKRPSFVTSNPDAGECVCGCIYVCVCICIYLDLKRPSFVIATWCR